MILGICLDMERYAYGFVSCDVPIWFVWRMVVCSIWNVSATSLSSSIYLVLTVFATKSVQIIFFSVVASKVKENANGARTFLEVVKVRFGKSTHLMFLVGIDII